MSKMNPILVTGMHNSGTTWVGKIISQAPDVFYIHELFNLNRNPGECNARFPYWFMYLTPDNESDYLAPLTDAISLKYNLLAGLKSSKSFKKDLVHFTKYAEYLRARIAHKRPLLKDPIAIFSAEWLNFRFNFTTIVILRHPCAVASSLKKRGWNHPFSHFLEQPLLMQDQLSQYEERIRYLASHEVDIIDQAALLWNIIYQVIATYQEKHKEWLFVRHEDLSHAPVPEFNKIFSYLGLSFTKRIERTINDYSLIATNKDSKQERKLHRDSKAIVDRWKHLLTVKEIEKIRNITWETARHYYPENDW